MVSYDDPDTVPPIKPLTSEPPVEKTLVMKAPRVAPPPPAAPSDRVLLPAGAEAAGQGSEPIPTKTPDWVLVYVGVALLLAIVGGCVLFLEARIVGHF